MAYIDTDNGDYPLTLEQVEKREADDGRQFIGKPPSRYPDVQAVEPPTVGADQRAIEGSPELASGVWRQTWLVGAGPRRLIPKSVIQERVNDIGKLEAVLAALQSQAILYARWFAPDWPNVFFDDENMLALLAAVGCTSGQIATITAPA